MNIGAKIQEYRENNGFSQEMLAEKLDVSRQSVSKWELGQTLPEIDKIVAMSKLFQITTDELLIENKYPDWVLYHWKMAVTITWAQLTHIIDVSNLKILDLGYGEDIAENFLANNNKVIRMEQSADIQANLKKLKDFKDSSFDVIVCHHVLEYSAENNLRVEIVKECSRILKSGGVLSVIKNNGAGRIMTKAVREIKIDEAVNLLEGGYNTGRFGRVVLYNPEDLVKWDSNLKIEKILGRSIFYGLQQNDVKNDIWIDKMFAIEMKVADMEPYKSIALYHHVLLRKL